MKPFHCPTAHFYRIAAFIPAHECAGMKAALPCLAEQTFPLFAHQKEQVARSLHVFNSIAFRWVPRRRARGKNATEFKSRAMRDRSCGCRQTSRMSHELNGWCRTTHQCHSRSPCLVGMGSRHKDLIPTSCCLSLNISLAVLCRSSRSW
jgi:hypothetical protein